MLLNHLQPGLPASSQSYMMRGKNVSCSNPKYFSIHQIFKKVFTSWHSLPSPWSGLCWTWIRQGSLV